MIDPQSTAHKSFPGGATSAVDPDAEVVNRWLLSAIARAWRHYPSAVELAYGDIAARHDLGKAVVGRLVEDGMVQIGDDGLALTRAGYAAIDQAARADERLSDLLRDATLPEPHASSSLVLAIMRAHFELRRGTAGR